MGQFLTKKLNDLAIATTSTTPNVTAIADCSKVFFYKVFILKCITVSFTLTVGYFQKYVQSIFSPCQAFLTNFVFFPFFSNFPPEHPVVSLHSLTY